MALDRRLIEKGQQEPLQGLLDQGGYSAALATQHAAELGEWSWTPEQTAAIASEIAVLDTDRSRQLDERAGAKQLTRVEGAAVTDAKALIGRMRNVARQVVRKNPGAGVTLDEFNGSGPLARSTPKILTYLAGVRGPAAKLEEGFRPYFKGESITALIDARRAALDTANSSQEVDIASLPADTALVYERKGRLLELIEDLNAVAKNAFYDDPEVKARFNKALLNRGRRRPTPLEG